MRYSHEFKRECVEMYYQGLYLDMVFSQDSEVDIGIDYG